jgi:RNA polymerase sigma factor (sigma-70 family)
MATAPSPTALKRICRLVAAQPTGRLPDAELLERFTLRREEAAFTALVRRHGPLVLGVCRRVLHNHHDAEDAFQATFLILARKARAITKQESVAGWLYQVAYRTALRARARAAGRQAREGRVVPRPAGDLLGEVTGREVFAVLDDELHQLPPRDRAPLVLCYLQGRTRDQAARQLGWSVRELKYRLDQGRKRLRARLARRGLALPTALLAAGLVEESALAVLPGPLTDATIRAALRTAAGDAVSATAATLADEALLAMAVTRLRLALAVFLAAATALLGGGILAQKLLAPAQGAAEPARASSRPPVKEGGRPALPEPVTFTGRILDANGRPLAGADAGVIGLPAGSSARRLWLMSDKVLSRARTGKDGRVRLVLPRKSLAAFDRLYLVAGATGHGIAWQKLESSQPKAETVLRLPAEKIIRGRVRDLQGLPVAGVRLRVSWLGTSGPAETRVGDLLKDQAPFWPPPAVTGRDGKFTIRGLNPRLHGYVFVEGERFAPHYLEIQTGAKVQEANVVLDPAQLIEGVVTAADTGKPMPQVQVSVNSDQHADAPDAMGPGVSGQTDAHGRFRLNPPPGKMFTVRANGLDGGPYLRAKLSFKWLPGAVRKEVKLALPRGVLIRGKVTEAGSGKPVAGAVVRDTVGLWINRTATTGADGSFQIAVRPGRGHLLIKGPGNDFVAREITTDELEGRKPRGHRMYPDAVVAFDLKPGAPPKDVTVQLRRGVTIRGRLVGPKDRPPEHALMLCWSQVPQHAPIWFAASLQLTDGRFELRGCDSEKTYTVHFLDPAHEQGATAQLSVKAAAGKLVTVRLGPCGSAEVRFVDGEGKPKASFRPIFYIVARRGPRDSPPGEADDEDFVANVDRQHYPGAAPAVDAQGRARFPALIPGAIYRILNYNLRSVKDFTVKPGEKLKLPDIVSRQPE